MFQFVNKTTKRGGARGSTKGRSRRPRNGGDSIGKYAGDAWSLAKRTAVGLNEIRKLINIEEKALIVTQTSTAFDPNGVLVSISSIVQGLDFTNRVGDSIKMQHIEVRGRIYKNATATQSLYRILLIRDLDGYGTTPNVGDIMEGVGTVSAPLTQLDFLNRKRFSVLYDELGTLNSTGDSTTVFEISMPHGGHILYLGTTAAAASNGKGSLYLLFLSDEGTNTPTFGFSSRIVFTDD